MIQINERYPSPYFGKEFCHQPLFNKLIISLFLWYKDKGNYFKDAIIFLSFLIGFIYQALTMLLLTLKDADYYAFFMFSLVLN